MRDDLRDAHTISVGGIGRVQHPEHDLDLRRLQVSQLPPVAVSALRLDDDAVGRRHNHLRPDEGARAVRFAGVRIDERDRGPDVLQRPELTVDDGPRLAAVLR